MSLRKGIGFCQQSEIRMYYLLFTVQFILFFIVQFTDYSKWKMISFFTITTVLILYSIYMHDTGKIIMCISDIIFISFCYWYYKKKEAK